MSVIGALATIASTVVPALFNLGSQKSINAKNEALQREAWEMQSISHRVKELEENGLNKQLATGMNPNYSLQAHLQSPELNLGKLTDYFASEASRENIRQDTKNKANQEHILESQADEAKARAEIAQHDAKIFLDRPYASTDPAFLRNISGIKNLILGEDSGINSFPDAVNKGLDLLYQLGDKNTKRIINNNRYKFEQKGGVSEHGKYKSENVLGGSGRDYYLQGSKKNSGKASQATFERNYSLNWSYD